MTKTSKIVSVIAVSNEYTSKILVLDGSIRPVSFALFLTGICFIFCRMTEQFPSEENLCENSAMEMDLAKTSQRNKKSVIFHGITHDLSILDVTWQDAVLGTSISMVSFYLFLFILFYQNAHGINKYSLSEKLSSIIYSFRIFL